MASAAAIMALVWTLATTAAAERPVSVVDGNLEAVFNGGIAPGKLSKVHPTPVRFILSARFRTLDGSHAPALREIQFEADRHARVDVGGIPICRRSQIEGKDTKAAEKVCTDSIVGTGWADAEVQFSDLELPPKLLVFNGGSRRGVTTLFLHAYLSTPVQRAVVTAVKIKRVKNGRYGLMATAKVPAIAAGSGSITSFRMLLDKRIVSATCSDGKLRARIAARFADGRELSRGLTRSCVPLAPAPTVAAAAADPDLFDFGFAPTHLSRTKPTPVRLRVAGRHGAVPDTHLPAATDLELELDRHFSVDLEAVPACEKRGPLDYRDEDPTNRCPDSVVARGRVTAEVAFPEQVPTSVASDLVVLSGPRDPGLPKLWAYGFFPAPVTAEILIPVELHRTNEGRFGWKLRAKIPKIAGGYGSITSYRLRFRRQVVAATCADGKLLAAAETTFADGTHQREQAPRTCSS